MSARPWAEGLEATSFSVVDGVATVTLERADAANARNQQMRNELKALWTGIAADDEIAVVVLTAAGDRFFCASMDQLAALPQPTIAAINGYALGGGLEMALACDLRIAAENAQLGLTELVHGLVPGGGGTQRLPRLVGSARAAEMLYLGLRLDAARSQEWGLVNRVVPFDDLASTAAEMAAAVAANSNRALRYAKELLRVSQDVPVAVGAQLELDSLLTLMADRQA